MGVLEHLWIPYNLQPGPKYRNDGQELRGVTETLDFHNILSPEFTSVILSLLLTNKEIHNIVQRIYFGSLRFRCFTWRHMQLPPTSITQYMTKIEIQHYRALIPSDSLAVDVDAGRRLLIDLHSKEMRLFFRPARNWDCSKAPIQIPYTDKHDIKLLRYNSKFKFDGADFARLFPRLKDIVVQVKTWGTPCGDTPALIGHTFRVTGVCIQRAQWLRTVQKRLMGLEPVFDQSKIRVTVEHGQIDRMQGRAECACQTGFTDAFRMALTGELALTKSQVTDSAKPSTKRAATEEPEVESLFRKRRRV